MGQQKLLSFTSTVLLYTCCFWVKQVYSSVCIHEKYGQFTSTHTGCVSVSASAQNSGVTTANQQVIVNLHNEKRALQLASNMQTMAWDDELALIAQRWTDHCVYEHDDVRTLPGRFSAGQNLAAGHASWTDVVNAWYDEVQFFTWGSDSMTFSDVGHYTQVVWAESAKIGCGYTYCENLSYKHFYACNYGPAGNLNWKEPFVQGNKCGDCATSCASNLCDCGGKVCENGGTLDINTCECSCAKPFHIAGHCALDCTAAVDESFCGPGNFYDGKCLVWSNVPDICPIDCNICPYSGVGYMTSAGPIVTTAGPAATTAGPAATTAGPAATTAGPAATTAGPAATTAATTNTTAEDTGGLAVEQRASLSMITACMAVIILIQTACNF